MGDHDLLLVKIQKSELDALRKDNAALQTRMQGVVSENGNLRRDLESSRQAVSENENLRRELESANQSLRRIQEILRNVQQPENSLTGWPAPNFYSPSQGRPAPPSWEDA